MGRADLVVAVGRQQQHRQCVDPPGHVAQQIQGGAVGPVQVFDHAHRGVAIADDADQSGVDLLGVPGVDGGP